MEAAEIADEAQEADSTTATTSSPDVDNTPLKAKNDEPVEAEINTNDSVMTQEERPDEATSSRPDLVISQAEEDQTWLHVEVIAK